MPAMLAIALLAGTPSSPASVSSATGTIVLPSDTSTIARQLYLQSGGDINGLVGYVVDLGARVPDGTPYTLRRTAGTGVVSLWAQFYSSLTGGLGGAGGRACPLFASGDGNGGENGSITCGDSDGDGTHEISDRARYAIIIAWVGPENRAGVSGAINAAFKLSW
jgi:hypothetical protein